MIHSVQTQSSQYKSGCLNYRKSWLPTKIRNLSMLWVNRHFWPSIFYSGVFFPHCWELCLAVSVSLWITRVHWIARSGIRKCCWEDQALWKNKISFYEISREIANCLACRLIVFYPSLKQYINACKNYIAKNRPKMQLCCGTLLQPT